MGENPEPPFEREGKEREFILVNKMDHVVDADEVAKDRIISAEFPAKLSVKEILSVTVSVLGISFCWGCQFSRISAIFQYFGLADRFLGAVWIAGPISGIFITPIVAALSDKCTCKWGKRKPFMLIGLIGVVLSFLMVLHAREIGLALGDTFQSRSHALLIAMSGFWLSDFFINAIQTPCRTLLVDLAPPSQQPFGNSCFSIMQGVGNVLVFAISGAEIGKYFPFLGKQGHEWSAEDLFFADVKSLYYLGIISIVITVGWTLFSVREIPGPSFRSNAISSTSPRGRFVILDEEIDESEEKSVSAYDVHRDLNLNRSRWSLVKSRIQSMCGSLGNFPSLLKRTCIIQIFLWYGWFCILVLTVPYVGIIVYHGRADPELSESDPLKQAYNRGVASANQALATNSFITLIFSLAMPKLIDRMGIKRVYLATTVLQAILMLIFMTESNSTLAFMTISLLGIPWASALVIPFTLAGQASAGSSTKGFNMALLNISVCLPQILMSVSSGFIIHYMGGLRSVFLFGGIMVSIAAFLITSLL